jgi:hypothetical protein
LPLSIPDVLGWYERRKKEIEEALRANGGVPRYETWLYEYYKNPYLLLISDEELEDRFVDFHSNVVGLNAEGKLSPDVEALQTDDIITSGWTQVTEALNGRGGLMSDLLDRANSELTKYFDDGDPLGVKLFAGRPLVLENSIVRFSKKSHLQEMLHLGRFRLAPASSYSQDGLLKSVKDFELERVCRVPAVHAALRGETHIVHNGNRLPIEGGAVTVKIAIPDDYYLFATCTELDRRMPTDFKADCAIVIKDVELFESQFRKAFLKRFGRSQLKGANVCYYDPFRRVPTKVPTEFWKHFSYCYQKEYRIVARPLETQIPSEPVFLEIGSMEHYAELLCLD